MKRAAMMVGLFAVAVIEPVAADPPSAGQTTLLNQVRAACQADAQNLCPGMREGGGRILSCLAQHKDRVSDACKQAVMAARQAQGQSPVPGQAQGPSETGGQSQSPGQQQDQGQSPGPSQGHGQGRSQEQGKSQGHSAPTAAAQPPSDRYFRMKRVQIADDGMNKMPAVDVMIPTTWQLQGSIRAMGGMGGASLTWRRSPFARRTQMARWCLRLSPTSRGNMPTTRTPYGR